MPIRNRDQSFLNPWGNGHFFRTPLRNGSTSKAGSFSILSEFAGSLCFLATGSVELPREDIGIGKKNYCNNLQMNQMNMECYSSLWCFSSGWKHLFQPLHLLFQHGSHCMFRNFAELCVVPFSHANHKVVLRT